MDYPKCIVTSQKEKSISIQIDNLSELNKSNILLVLINTDIIT